MSDIYLMAFYIRIYKTFTHICSKQYLNNLTIIYQLNFSFTYYISKFYLSIHNNDKIPL